MRTSSILSLLLVSLLCACSGGELVGVHVKLATDGTGTITTRALMPIATATETETQASGINWQVRAGLVSSQGRFDAISDVKLGANEVTFAPQLEGERPGLRVTLNRGPERKWVRSLAPAREQRKGMAKAYDPTGRTKQVGDVLRLEIEAPGNVITSGVLPSGRGVEADREGSRATLLLPVRTALEEGDSFVWDISWMHGK